MSAYLCSAETLAALALSAAVRGGCPTMAGQSAKVADRRRAFEAYPTLGPKETATVIRRVLKAAFPACKFSVITERGSMVSSVRIGWVDGPTTKAVDALVKCFTAGDFDGMTDSYNYDRDSLLDVEGTLYRPCCQYVFTTRTISPDFATRLLATVGAYYRVTPPAIIVKDSFRGTKFWTLERDTYPVEGLRYSWCDLIHQASSDRSRFAASVEGR